MTGAGAVSAGPEEIELPASRTTSADVPRIPLRRKFALVGVYARERLARQVRAVAFITAYLALFQLFVLQAPILEFAQIALGILAVVVGLAWTGRGQSVFSGPGSVAPAPLIV